LSRVGCSGNEEAAGSRSRLAWLSSNQVSALCTYDRLAQQALALSLCTDSLSPPHRTNDVNDEDEVQIEIHNSSKRVSKGDHRRSRQEMVGEDSAGWKLLEEQPDGDFSYAYDLGRCSPLVLVRLAICMARINAVD